MRVVRVKGWFGLPLSLRTPEGTAGKTSLRGSEREARDLVYVAAGPAEPQDVPERGREPPRAFPYTPYVMTMTFMCTKAASIWLLQQVGADFYFLISNVIGDIKVIHGQRLRDPTRPSRAHKLYINTCGIVFIASVMLCRQNSTTLATTLLRMFGSGISLVCPLGPATSAHAPAVHVHVYRL